MSKDPMLKVTQASGREAFKALSKTIDQLQLPLDVVAQVAANLLINALRQKHSQRDAAEQELKTIMERSITVLGQHYIGQRRVDGAFPFPQTIEMPHADLSNKRIIP